MGITGLLPLIKPALQKKPIKAYKGARIGIDGHAWLHQLCPQIAHDLYHTSTTTKHIPLIKKKLQLLQAHSIVPILIFDGQALPSKQHTTELRAARKAQAQAQVAVLLQKGRKAEANSLMRQCVSISRSLVTSLIAAIPSVTCIIAPYEADAQLAYLQRIGYIDCIMSEDSDLVIYDCTNVLYKFDTVSVMEYKRERLNKLGDQFLVQNLQDICILSGCDYVKSISGIGLKTAITLLKKHRDIENCIQGIAAKKIVPEDYFKEFLRAKLTFKYQIVYNPLKDRREFLGGELENGHLFPFLGSIKGDDYKYIQSKDVDNRDNNNSCSTTSTQNTTDSNNLSSSQDTTDSNNLLEEDDRSIEMKNIDSKDPLAIEYLNLINPTKSENKENINIFKSNIEIQRVEISERSKKLLDKYKDKKIKDNNLSKRIRKSK